MRVRVAAVLPLLLLLAACDKSPRDKLQGSWVGVEATAIHPSQAAAANGWARGLRLEIAGNKATVGVPAESPRSGTFKVAKADDGQLDVCCKRPEGGEDRSRMAFREDGKLVWTLGGGVQVVMTKAQ